MLKCCFEETNGSKHVDRSSFYLISGAMKKAAVVQMIATALYGFRIYFVR